VLSPAPVLAVRFESSLEPERLSLEWRLDERRLSPLLCCLDACGVVFGEEEEDAARSTFSGCCTPLSSSSSSRCISSKEAIALRSAFGLPPFAHLPDDECRRRRPHENSSLWKGMAIPNDGDTRWRGRGREGGRDARR